MSFSLFGDKFTRHTGIARLMEDMGEGLRTPGAVMLGGGNPAQIPAMNDYFHQLLMHMQQEGKLTDALCNYDGPRGKAVLLEALAALLQKSWAGRFQQKYCPDQRQPERLFYLFNLYAGRRADGTKSACCFHWRRNISAMRTPDWMKICLSPPALILSCCRKDSLNTMSILTICRSPTTPA